MREIMDIKAERKAKLAEHPFYTRWIDGSGVPAEHKLSFAPIMVNFVMNFRDINKWFLRYQSPANDFEKIINGNTLEDETHSRLFMEDWKKLRFDETLGWRASDTIWWMFLAEDTEPFRQYGMDFSRMSVEDGGDPLVRFAHSEAGEACGNMFFDRVSRAATALTEKTGIDYRYFGVYHLNKEPGHVIGSEGVFEREILGDRQRSKALELEHDMFDIFFGMHDAFLGYAEKYVASGTSPKRTRGKALAARGRPAPRRSDARGIGLKHAEVQCALDARKARTAAHPFFTWLRDEKNGVSPLRKLQRFLPMWLMDIMGYRDLNTYCFRYAHPADHRERGINRWVDALQTHSALFLDDWDALGMDDLLGWTAGDTLRFCFLDPQMDVHRLNIAKFIKLAFGYPDPVLRYWLMEALESSGDAFFQNTKALATRVEHETGIQLDYLGDRHDGPADLPQGDGDSIAFFKREPMGTEERDVALDMVKIVFDAVDEQLSISLEVARTNRLGIDDPSHARDGGYLRERRAAISAGEHGPAPFARAPRMRTEP